LTGPLFRAETPPRFGGYDMVSESIVDYLCAQTHHFFPLTRSTVRIAGAGSMTQVLGPVLTSSPTSALNLPLKIRDSHLPAFSSNSRHTPRVYLILRFRTTLTILRHAFTPLPFSCLLRHLYLIFCTLHPTERVESLIFFDRHLLRPQ
jgi:hypothetical protein